MVKEFIEKSMEKKYTFGNVNEIVFCFIFLFSLLFPSNFHCWKKHLMEELLDTPLHFPLIVMKEKIELFFLTKTTVAGFEPTHPEDN